MSGELQGMTGFARVSGEAEWGSWVWEAKSVNGRGLDVRVNVPAGFEAFEQVIKRAAPLMFSRGSMQISLRVEPNQSSATASINEAMLSELVRVHNVASGTDNLSDEAIAALMTIKGVVETGASSTRELAKQDGVIGDVTPATSTLLGNLKTARLQEGESLKKILTKLIVEMQRDVAEAEALASEQPALLRARLEKQLAELDADRKVDADRLAAEIALSAAKADVREELDRLKAHLETAKAHLAEGSPIGRKLDFLSQELNRETNTLCSKSISLDLTNAGLSLKGLVDQFKEQAANVE